MPWHVGSSSRCPSGKPFAVIKDSDQSVAGCHPTREAANAQLAALYASESGAEPANAVGVAEGKSVMFTIPTTSVTGTTPAPSVMYTIPTTQAW